MNTNNCEPSFQLIANSISKIELENTLVNISDSDDLIREFNIGVKKITIEEHENYKSAGLDVEIKINITKKDGEKNKRFTAAIVICGIFVDSDNTSDEELKSKLKINGVAALYSIARGCITNISSQALAEGKIVLPLVNFFEFAKSSSENDSKEQ